MLSNETYDVIRKHHEAIQAKIDYSRDFNYDYFGFKTLERAYLIRENKQVVERP
jgi:hypothetical protein